MPKTPADFGGPLYEDIIWLYDQYENIPLDEGTLFYSDGYFYGHDQYGSFNLRSGSGGGAGGLVDPHANTHIRGSSDEIDGDKIDIDFSPIVYTPNVNPPITDNIQNISSHLYGIDAYLGNLSQIKLNTDEHETLRHLIHFIDAGPASGFASGAYSEILPAANPFPTSIIWYTSSSKTAKIVELTITRDSQKKPTIEIWRMYDVDGLTVLATITDSILYSGPFEISRTRVIL